MDADKLTIAAERSSKSRGILAKSVANGVSPEQVDNFHLI